MGILPIQVAEKDNEDAQYFGNCCILEFDVSDDNEIKYVDIHNLAKGKN